jgi:Immunoglobulin I-set domain
MNFFKFEFSFCPQISWVRRRDWHILTSGMFTYTNDERFQVLHAEGSDDWTLQIKYVQKRDNGTYECQVGQKQLILHFEPYNAHLPLFWDYWMF